MTNQECADMLRRARARQRQEEAERLERLMFTHRVTARCQLADADALSSRYTPAPTPNASLKPYAIAAVLVLVLMSAASAALLTITGA